MGWRGGGRTRDPCRHRALSERERKTLLLKTPPALLTTPTRALARLAARVGDRFYPALALLLFAATAGMLSTGRFEAVQNQAYDFAMQWRVHAPAADPEIVILDIDEASLDAMAQEYGRWPWPRAVLAETAQALLDQGARAVVFDIVFSDADLTNPDSDQLLADTVARDTRIFTPVIRLSPENDALSQLRLDSLPGVTRAPATADAPSATGATVALVTPYFLPVIREPRLGTNNLYLDGDGLTRRYHVYRDIAGLRLPSLPTAIVRAQGGRTPEQADVLLNWRGGPGTYTQIPFHAFHADTLREHKQRAPDEFHDRIVIIGSTAPSLFDVKPTPMAQLHPGVEILATATDNLRQGDYVHMPPRWLTLVLTALALTVLTWAFLHQIASRWLNLGFLITQLTLLVLSWAALQVSAWYVDASVAVSCSLAYFSFAGFFSTLLARRASGHPLYSDLLTPGHPPGYQVRAVFLALKLPENDRARHAARLHREANRGQYGVAAVSLFSDLPLPKTLFTGTLFFYWLAAPGDESAVLGEVQRLVETAGNGIMGALHTTTLEPGTDPGRTPDGHIPAWHIQDWHTQGQIALLATLSLAAAGTAREIARTHAFRAWETEMASQPI